METEGIGRLNLAGTDEIHPCLVALRFLDERHGKMMLAGKGMVPVDGVVEVPLKSLVPVAVDTALSRRIVDVVRRGEQTVIPPNETGRDIEGIGDIEGKDQLAVRIELSVVVPLSSFWYFWL